MPTTENTTNYEFWTRKYTPKGDILDIDISMFIEFLEISGFRNFETGLERQLVRLENNILKRVESFQINSFAKEYLKNFPEDLNTDFSRSELTKSFHRKLITLVHKDQLHTLQVIIPNYKKDTKTQSFKFFKNCFVEVTKDSIITHPYDQLNGVIWESQIIDRNFEVLDVEIFNSNNEFYQFLWNCMGHDQNRLNSIMSIIGYLIHTYKDSANSKAVIFCDERVSDEPNGGSGKSLTVKAISQFVKTAFEDGKTFNPNASFAFQQVEFDTKLIFIDDVVKNFKIEPLFSPITGGITIEKKYKNKIQIKSEDSPKFIITTNYIIEGRGISFGRRKIELEFSTHYNEINTPDSEFKHRLFDDWLPDQWLSFDNFMIYCIKFYMAKGVITPLQINISRRKLIQETKRELVEFADALPRNKELNKTSVFNDFLGQYPDFQRVRQRTFTDWLKIYAEYSDDIIQMSERHSDGNRFFVFIQGPPKVK